MQRDIFIDINCDVGEGLDNEATLMPLISSCNIACGAHAGDKETIIRIAKLAKKNAVKVGAHPSYPDRKNFGRISMDLPKADFIASIQQQVNLFSALLNIENIKLHHIKAHGALYNDMGHNHILAKSFLKAIANYKDEILLYAPYGSALAIEGQKQKFSIVFEAFADRNYDEDGNLVSRKDVNAIISNPDKVFTHMLRMVKEQYVLTSKGFRIPIKAETFCIHSDTPSALEILRYLTAQLPKMKINIKK
ncbi:5-oxoprolinase subunit PxpA [Aurantibacter sp.]|uniref:5-oxoprolinase subunit PxpA n=1 Tax=Aurantibacter sp. TaxID=2807103 RepID=UPI0032654DC3